MSKPFYLGAYWGARPETPAACAQRLADMLKRLGDINAQLGSWYEKGTSPTPDPELRIDPAANTLTALVEKGSQRAGDRPMPELGYAISAWNGRDPGISLAVTCGATATTGVSNAVALTLPAPEDAPDLYGRSVALDILAAVVETWEPDWATLTSHPIRRAQGPTGPGIVYGWATWRDGDAFTALDAVDVDRIAIGSGTALVLPDRPGPDVPTDAVLAVRDASTSA